MKVSREVIKKMLEETNSVSVLYDNKEFKVLMWGKKDFIKNCADIMSEKVNSLEILHMSKNSLDITLALLIIEKLLSDEEFFKAYILERKGMRETLQDLSVRKGN
jgi:hypothetical protein